MSTELETSYGGVVVRGDEVLVITPTGRTVTGLPKGGMEAGETPEQAAAREGREETGVGGAGRGVRGGGGGGAAVREPLGDVRYTYRRGGRRVRKTVHLFLCDYVEGSTADHDHEVDEARWIAISGAREALTYPGERALIDRLLSKMACGR